MHAYKYIIAVLECVYVCTHKHRKTEKEKNQSAQASGDFSWKSNCGKSK